MPEVALAFHPVAALYSKRYFRVDGSALPGERWSTIGRILLDRILGFFANAMLRDIILAAATLACAALLVLAALRLFRRFDLALRSRASISRFEGARCMRRSSPPPAGWKASSPPLRRSIQDSFAKAGIEIMTPSYYSLRDGSKSTIPGSGA